MLALTILIVSSRTLFLLTQTGSVYIHSTSSIGSSIASFRLVGKAGPVQHQVSHKAGVHYGYHLARFYRSTQRSGSQTPAGSIPHYRFPGVVCGTDATHIP